MYLEDIAATTVLNANTATSTRFTSTLNDFRIATLCLEKFDPITDNCLDSSQLKLTVKNDTIGSRNCNGNL